MSVRYKLTRNVTVDGRTWARGQQIIASNDKAIALMRYPKELYPWLVLYERDGKRVYPHEPFVIEKPNSKKQKDDN